MRSKKVFPPVFILLFAISLFSGVPGFSQNSEKIRVAVVDFGVAEGAKFKVTQTELDTLMIKFHEYLNRQLNKEGSKYTIISMDDDRIKQGRKEYLEDKSENRLEKNQCGKFGCELNIAQSANAKIAIKAEVTSVNGSFYFLTFTYTQNATDGEAEIKYISNVRVSLSEKSDNSGSFFKVFSDIFTQYISESVTFSDYNIRNVYNEYNMSKISGQGASNITSNENILTFSDRKDDAKNETVKINAKYHIELKDNKLYLYEMTDLNNPVVASLPQGNQSDEHWKRNVVAAIAELFCMKNIIYDNTVVIYNGGISKTKISFDNSDKIEEFSFNTGKGIFTFSTDKDKSRDIKYDVNIISDETTRSSRIYEPREQKFIRPANTKDKEFMITELVLASDLWLTKHRTEFILRSDDRSLTRGFVGLVMPGFYQAYYGLPYDAVIFGGAFYTSAAMTIMTFLNASNYMADYRALGPRTDQPEFDIAYNKAKKEYQKGYLLIGITSFIWILNGVDSYLRVDPKHPDARGYKLNGELYQKQASNTNNKFNIAFIMEQRKSIETDNSDFFCGLSVHTNF